MNDDENIIALIENQVEKMILKINLLEQKNFELMHKLTEIEVAEEANKLAYKNLNSKYNALKSASSFLGSEENKKETKLKINALVRDINYCISQLSTS